MDEIFSLRGKRILVTGGTRGIGRAISLHLARAGAAVIANYVLRDSTANSLKEEAVEQGLNVQTCKANLTTSTGIERLCEAVGAEGLSAMVHCAATGVHRPLQDLTLQHWDFTFSLNARAFFQLVLLLLPKFHSQASIIALSSEGAVHAYPTYSLVGASKGALESLCRHLAVELTEKGLRVNVLSPGSVLTDAWEAFPDKEQRIKEAVRRSPMGRLTTPEEVAYCAQFLCSDASVGINGHTLVVDGGQRIRG